MLPWNVNNLKHDFIENKENIENFLDTFNTFISDWTLVVIISQRGKFISYSFHITKKYLLKKISRLGRSAANSPFKIMSKGLNNKSEYNICIGNYCSKV